MFTGTVERVGGNSISGSDVLSINELLDELRGSKRENTTSYQNILTVSLENILVLARSSEGVVVGMATLVCYAKFDKKVGHVEDVVVHSSHQRQGIARLIIECIIAEAKKQGVIQLQLTSNPRRQAAHALYRSLGFGVRDTSVFRLKL